VSWTNPLAAGPTVLVTAVGAAEGSRGAAAALACAGSDVDRAALLVDVGGRAPRPTLLASAAAQRLEERLAAHLPELRVAARGQVCHLVVPADGAGLDAASAAVSVARGAVAAVHLPAALVQLALASGLDAGATGMLLRAELPRERPLVALAVRDLITRDLAVTVLKRRLGWVAERRALFGAMPADAPGGLPRPILVRLLSHECYPAVDDPEADPTRASQRERKDHAGTRSR
jgi:hypothetical protein